MVTMTFSNGGYAEYACLSTDTKPTDCATGSICAEVDTGKIFLFDSEGETWVEQFSLQG